jgi:hypothetical protein
MIWIQSLIVSFTLQTTTEAIDLQDGHPNHQLWKKMIDAGLPPSSDR